MFESDRSELGGFGARLQELVVFLIVAGIACAHGTPLEPLLLSHAALERERTNLARYFSPTVVQELSKNDEPLKQVRTQNVAVLFVDIVGFTAYADGKNPGGGDRHPARSSTP